MAIYITYFYISLSKITFFFSYEKQFFQCYMKCIDITYISIHVRPEIHSKISPVQIIAWDRFQQNKLEEEAAVPAPVYTEYSTCLHSNEVSSTCSKYKTKSHRNFFSLLSCATLLAESNQELYLRINFFSMETYIFVYRLPQDFSTKVINTFQVWSHRISATHRPRFQS